MARLTNEQLQKIKDKYHVSRVWSWSKINTYMTSKYEYLLKYILHEEEDRCDSCYTTLGTICHDTLDAFYEGKMKYEDMIDNYNDGFMTAITIADLKFNRSDAEKNKSIGEKYNENLVHFFKNHTVYKHNLLIEKPITANINDNVFVGYIDAVYKDDDDNYHIIDFKSSSIYTGKTLEDHSGQLTIYAIGLSQMGIPLNKIKINFNFLKYCTIKYEQKNGEIKYRNVERCKIGESLQSNAKTWLKAFKYDPDEYLKLLLDTNSIECLPEEVKEKYEITDCYVYINLTDDLINKWIDTITTTIQDIELREADYKETKSDKCFWDNEDSIKAQSYYYSNLCSYSINKLLPYKEYLDKMEAAKNGEDLFVGIGSGLNNSITTTDKVISNNTTNNEIDLSWLNDI